ncbi:Heterogeneous nuclear ribonucleoprotein 1 [Acorus calamus]|uniref:Heterogeneous nuclear ribonucleoprotein 1 n=1 Tax=Acorus calamus TaxID=4465 RepID=A0AAV9EU26_ACOCL|nr:Heterogeneous nuclear ribonucleoprotein 1 [Acorus calamus]
MAGGGRRGRSAEGGGGGNAGRNGGWQRVVVAAEGGRTESRMRGGGGGSDGGEGFLRDLVEIKRTIPKGSVQSDFKTKKIFVGGIPPTATDDEFKDHFSTYGKVVDHQIIRDHSTSRS